jgi:hypothetical protein
MTRSDHTARPMAATEASLARPSSQSADQRPAPLNSRNTAGPARHHRDRSEHHHRSQQHAHHVELQVHRRRQVDPEREQPDQGNGEMDSQGEGHERPQRPRKARKRRVSVSPAKPQSPGTLSTTNQVSCARGRGHEGRPRATRPRSCFPLCAGVTGGGSEIGAGVAVASLEQLVVELSRGQAPVDERGQGPSALRGQALGQSCAARAHGICVQDSGRGSFKPSRRVARMNHRGARARAQPDPAR